MTRALVITAMLLVVATLLSSQRVNQPALGADEGNKQHAIARRDQDFVKNAASGGMLEVALGRHAARHADSALVRAFGQAMVGDHSRANEQLKSLAKSRGIEVPARMQKHHTDSFEKLVQLEGKDLDAQYINHMVRDHQQDIKEFQDEVDHGGNQAIQDFARTTLPTLKQHLSMAEKVQAELK
jgi:putative membrane protein